jgi:hypothetical protein
MSNFAERLAARSAGASPGPGISLLTLRPRSRFEPVASSNIETDAGLTSIESFVATRTATDLESDSASASTPARTRVEWGKPVGKGESAVPQPLEYTNHRPKQVANIVSPTPHEVVAPDPPTDAGERVPEPIAAKPYAGDALSERHETVTMHHSANAPRREIPEQAVHTEVAVSPPAQQPPNEHISPPVPTHQTRSMPAAREVEVQSAPAPVISIGKIEVQFLPQEPRVAPRPQSQRTRGFDAYARARRGEPR